MTRWAVRTVPNATPRKESLNGGGAIRPVTCVDVPETVGVWSLDSLVVHYLHIMVGARSV